LFLSPHFHCSIQRLLQKKSKIYRVFLSPFSRGCKVFIHSIIFTWYYQDYSQELKYKKETNKKHAVKSIQKQPQRMAKPQKFPLQPKTFFFFFLLSFILFHQHNNTWKWVWRMKRREKVQLKFRDKNRFLCLPTFFMKLLFAVLGCFAVDVNSKKKCVWNTFEPSVLWLDLELGR